MAGIHAIFRLTTGGNNTEALVSDKIEFNGDAVVPDSRAFLDSIRPVYQAVNTDTPNPGSQNSPNSQDTGNVPFILELKGHFDETGGTTLGINTLNNWSENPKVIKTLYPKGRFGFRSDERDEYNVTPVASGGYQLTFIDMIDVLEFSRIEFTLRLKFVGDMNIRGV